MHKGYAYARTGNPTRMALERCVADLENGTTGFAFASGSAAAATILECLDAGAHVIATDDLYGGTLRLFERVRQRNAGLMLTRVDMSDPAAVEAAIREDTRLIWVETPTNPMLKLVDLAAVAAIGRKHGIWTVADNTFASPYVQQPLDHGCSAVIHSTTKYLNGHSDVIGGIAVVGEDAELAERLAFLQNAVGRSQDRSTVSSCCAVSRLWRCAWSGTAPTHSRSSNFWQGTRRYDASFVPASRHIRSMLSLADR